jgi:chemotaxis protein MotB
LRKNAKKSQAPKGSWMGTFNDLVTLLLTFFVLLLSMSKLNVAEEKEASYSYSNASGFLEGGGIIDTTVFTPFVEKLSNPHPFAKSHNNGRTEVARRINQAGRMPANMGGKGDLEASGGEPAGEDSLMYARVKATEISAVLQEKLIFQTGMAEIENKNHPALKTLCSILRETDCRIKVEGHTDNVPMHSGRFASNWELSAARAVSVLKYFISEGGISPQRLSAAAYGDSRPIFPNTGDRRRELNRRVEVVLMFDNKELMDG